MANPNDKTPKKLTSIDIGHAVGRLNPSLGVVSSAAVGRATGHGEPTEDDPDPKRAEEARKAKAAELKRTAARGELDADAIDKEHREEQ